MRNILSNLSDQKDNEDIERKGKEVNKQIGFALDKAQNPKNTQSNRLHKIRNRYLSTFKGVCVCAHARMQARVKECESNSTGTVRNTRDLRMIFFYFTIWQILTL